MMMEALGRSPSNLECALQLKKKIRFGKKGDGRMVTDHFECLALHDLKQFDH